MAAQIFARRGRFLEYVTDCGVVSGNEAIESECKRVAMEQADIDGKRVLVEAVDIDQNGKIHQDKRRYVCVWDAKYQRYAIPPTYRKGALSTHL
jgi:hypothetical protein